MFYFNKEERARSVDAPYRPRMTQEISFINFNAGPRTDETNKCIKDPSIGIGSTWDHG